MATVGFGMILTQIGCTTSFKRRCVCRTDWWCGRALGNGLNTVSESTVSNTELSEFFLALPEFRGDNSVSSSQPFLCEKKSELTGFFFAELTEFATELSEFSLPKQYSRNSVPPVS